MADLAAGVAANRPPLDHPHADNRVGARHSRVVGRQHNRSLLPHWLGRALRKAFPVWRRLLGSGGGHGGFGLCQLREQVADLVLEVGDAVVRLSQRQRLRSAQRGGGLSTP